ncbi:hypothetical protein BKA63DRAFT_543245 [Paraphoma chrysanthemicola]|nr:hypothetical protein BKA63DRAFT_543245 [Paraphoma chrysanthemicola]
MPLPLPNVAFVTGVNGISGYAIADFLVKQSDKDWSEIIITSRSPLTIPFIDHRVRFVPIDFLDDNTRIERALQPYASRITHAFFTSYVHVDDFKKLSELNVPLFTNFLHVLDKLSPNLQRITLQTGGKNYGAHLGEPLVFPAKEDQPRCVDPHNFYFKQEDALKALQSKRKTWSWNVIMPTGIVGVSPHGSGISEALSIAVYLLVHRELNEAAIWPWGEFMFSAPDDKSYAPGLAHFTVWAATQHHCANEAFNYVNGDVLVWKHLWKKLADYFGVEDKKEVWKRVVAKHGGKVEAFEWSSWAHLDWAIGKSWYTLLSMSKAREYGWTRTDDTSESFLKTIRSFENAGILPQSTVLVA